MDTDEKRMRRCCFTGHRPEKWNRPESEIRKELEREIKNAYEDGFDVFISGMARGVDIIAAEIVIDMQNVGIPVKLLCACPYRHCEQKWGFTWQSRFNAVLAAADCVKYISDEFSMSCYMKRNRWMVDHSARVIALYDGKGGGTKLTVDYARNRNVPVAFCGAY